MNVVLAIESSCDETSAAVLVDGKLRSNIISSQLFHSRFGGVVPELAARAHDEAITPVAREALAKAQVTVADVTHVAATYAPGLIGSLVVGLNFAKAFAMARNIPFIGVHHIEAHVFSTFLEDPHPEFPFLALVVSGGHTLIIKVQDSTTLDVIGSTRDDAAGEAFDKVAKMMGLGYPGGPIIDKLAREGDPKSIKLPRGLEHDGSFDFSFSGLKTAVRYYLARLPDEEKTTDTTKKNLAASFQRSVVDVLVAKLFAAAEKFDIKDVTIVGGVSANSELRLRLQEEAAKRGMRAFIPKFEYCTDNAAMIGMLGWLRLREGAHSDFSLTAKPYVEVGR